MEVAIKTVTIQLEDQEIVLRLAAAKALHEALGELFDKSTPIITLRSWWNGTGTGTGSWTLGPGDLDAPVRITSVR